MARQEWLLLYRENARFYLALVLSVILHAAILSWELKHPTSRETGSSVMTVTISSSRIDSLSSPEPANPDDGKSFAEQLLTSNKSPVLVSPDRRQGRQAPTHLHSTLASQGVAAKIEVIGNGNSTSIEVDRRPAVKPGQARFVMEVSSDGRIGQIIWDKLPAMDTETFNRLEATIRARGYVGSPSGGFLRQTINVRDYIDMPE